MKPLVGVVIVDYDGGDLTLACLRSVVATEWPEDRLTIVLVDNASRSPVTDRVRDQLPGVRVVESSRNLGFAGGVNLGLDALGDVDHVALLNNDATVDPGWLAPLVDAIEADRQLGAACPKILFADPFVELELRSHITRRLRGDRRDRGVRVSGVEIDGVEVSRRAQYVDGFWGPEHGTGDEPTFRWTKDRARLRVPKTGGARRARIRLAADGPTRVHVEVASESDAQGRDLTVTATPTWHDIPVDGDAFEVVNNVGNELVADGYGADRGYLEPDRGQHDAPVDVFGWCGGAVLLSGEYLDDVGYLDARLFIYYEDLEHSWRGRDRGWRYRTVPESVVRHVHAATSVEGSELSHHYNERNHLLVLVRHASFRLVTRAFVRHLLVTASYARRDVLGRWLRREAARTVEVRRRLRAFGAALRHAPAMLVSRLRDHRRRPRRMTPS